MLRSLGKIIARISDFLIPAVVGPAIFFAIIVVFGNMDCDCGADSGDRLCRNDCEICFGRRRRKMNLNAAMLARVQFAFTASYHIIFPIMSIGLAMFLAVIEGLCLKTKDDLYLQIHRFRLSAA
jgi:hypothetical protein